MPMRIVVLMQLRLIRRTWWSSRGTLVNRIKRRNIRELARQRLRVRRLISEISITSTTQLETLKTPRRPYKSGSHNLRTHRRTSAERQSLKRTCSRCWHFNSIRCYRIIKVSLPAGPINGARARRESFKTSAVLTRPKPGGTTNDILIYAYFYIHHTHTSICFIKFLTI